MSNLPQRATVQLTQALLNSVPRTKDILDLPAVRDNWVRTYNRISGKQDGAMRYEAEKILFMQAVTGNKAFDYCERFTLYAAFIELALSTLTLRDGISYIIPYGKKATFQVGWKGRLEQINELPDVVFVAAPQLVYDCDAFDYEKGMKLVIHRHKPGIRTPESKITHVYLVIKFDHGQEAYLMDAMDVISIRDNYSQSYKQYMSDLAKPANAGRKYGDRLLITGKDGATWESNDLPMWVSDEGQAFKKTLVRRVYNELPKLPKHKWLDSRQQQLPVEIEDTDFESMASQLTMPPPGAEIRPEPEVMQPAHTPPPPAQPEQPAAPVQVTAKEIMENNGGAPAPLQKPADAAPAQASVFDNTDGF